MKQPLIQQGLPCLLAGLHGVCTFFREQVTCVFYGFKEVFFLVAGFAEGVFQRMLVVGFVPLPTPRWLSDIGIPNGDVGNKTKSKTTYIF